MVRYQSRDVRKLSPGKATLAGEKQVFRKSEGRDGRGMYMGDIIGLRDESIEDGQPLLVKVMEQGERLHDSPSLQEIQNQFKKNFSRLEDRYKRIHEKHVYPVTLSSRLAALQKQL
jgi:nicotinate phosphoribosyltransferase